MLAISGQTKTNTMSATTKLEGTIQSAKQWMEEAKKLSEELELPTTIDEIRNWTEDYQYLFAALSGMTQQFVDENAITDSQYVAILECLTGKQLGLIKEALKSTKS